MIIQVENPLPSVDCNGDLFKHQGKYYRAFSAEKTKTFVKPLMESGLIEELVNKKLMAPIKYSKDKIEGYSTVLEQDELAPVVYPYEWSFSMLKDCGEAFLKLAETANRYGYYLKDCHPYNFVFHEGSFLWVDLGSFCKDNEEFSGFLAMSEFLKQYYFLLKIWNKIDSFAECLMNGKNISLINMKKILSPLYHFLPRGIAFHLGKLLEMYYNLYGINYEGIERRNKSKVTSYVAKLVKATFIPDNKRQFIKWARRLRKLKAPQVPSQWGGYHDSVCIAEDLRFCKIADLLRELKCESIMELAGNAGEFSLYLLKHEIAKQIICTDLDYNAIDKLYIKISNNKLKGIIPAQLDLMEPKVLGFAKLPFERYKSDVVLALAVTHHLILSNGYHLRDILEQIAKYSKKYFFIEFMPNGVWIKGQEVSVPEWYNEKWFEDEFRKYFVLNRRVQLEPNRILFVGEIFS